LKIPVSQNLPLNIQHGFVGIKSMIRFRGVPVKNKLKGFYINLKSDDPCPSPVIATIMFNREKTIFNGDTWIRITKQTATSLAQNDIVVLVHQLVPSLSMTC